MFSGAFIPPALGFTRGLAFLFRFFFFSFSVVVFLHSEASSKGNFRRDELSQQLSGHHRFALRSGCRTTALPPPAAPLVTATLPELGG